MGLKFNQGAFTAGFNQGASAVKDKLKRDADNKAAEIKTYNDNVTKKNNLAVTRATAISKELSDFDNKIATAKDNVSANRLRDAKKVREQQLIGSYGANFGTTASGSAFLQAYQPDTNKNLFKVNVDSEDILVGREMKDMIDNSDVGTFGFNELGKLTRKDIEDEEPFQPQEVVKYNEAYSVDKTKDTTTDFEKKYQDYLKSVPEGEKVLTRGDFDVSQAKAKQTSKESDQDKRFNIHKAQILKENPNINKIELDTQSLERATATSSERTDKRIENKEKALFSITGKDFISDINIAEAKKDKKTSSLIETIFRERAERRMGKKWTEEVRKASTSFKNAEALEKSGNIFAKDITEGKDTVNAFKKLFDSNIGIYFDKEMTDPEKAQASKGLSAIMNIVRSQQFGAVLPKQDMERFKDAATSLYSSSPDVVRGVSAMMEDQLGKLRISKDILGEDLFHLKYGNKVQDLEQKIGELKEIALNSKNKSPKTNKTITAKDAKGNILVLINGKWEKQ